MKYFVKFLILSTIFYACNSADVEVKGEKELGDEVFAKAKGQIVSPEGYVVTNSLDDLKKILFESNIDHYNIVDIDFVKLNINDGALAYVNYEVDGISANVTFAIGNVNVGYRNAGDVMVKKRYVPIDVIQGTGSGNDKVTVYKCKGLGCCYVGGETNLNTGQHTFYCKCETDPNQNSGCSLEVTEVAEDKTLNPG